MSAESRPAYVDLPKLAGERCAWNYFGRGNELGTLGFIGEKQILKATASVTKGLVFNLDLPMDFGIQLSSSRKPMTHVLLDNRHGMDDYVDSYYLSSSTQWDGFRHISIKDEGFFGGVSREEFDNSSLLGIGAWAKRGIVGRGLLVDIEGFARSTKAEWFPEKRSPITPEIIEKVLQFQESKLEEGDILLLRTGWLTWFRGSSEQERGQSGKISTLSCAGLSPHPEMVAWLWDHGISAVAADNPALEVLPVSKEEGFLHRRLLAMLGMPFGEYFDFDALASACREQGRFHGMLVSHPLYLPGGVGTPANAYMVL